MAASTEELGSTKIGIVGLGYVGLPLAVEFADAGCQVIALDSDGTKVASLNSRQSYIEDIPSSRLGDLKGTLVATSEYKELSTCEAVIICVPTPLTNSRAPDLTHLIAAAERFAEVLRPGQLVVIESTTYPGTTRDLVAPLLSADLEAGKDFALAFSPERIDPGRKDFSVSNTPKVVGGLTLDCTRQAQSLYENICDTVIPVSTPETAEITKLLENIFRLVNIAFINEMARLCDLLNIDIWEVIDAAATKPFGLMKFEPGPGVGGHCLPVDPFYLAFKARENDFFPEFIELAGKINQYQPHYCVERIQRFLNERGLALRGANILLLGVSYKANIGDVRESPALRMIQLLRGLGAEVSYYDSHVPRLVDMGLSSVDDLEDAVQGNDLAVLVTAHSDVELNLVVDSGALILDLRGVSRGIDSPQLGRL